MGKIERKKEHGIHLNEIKKKIQVLDCFLKGCKNKWKSVLVTLSGSGCWIRNNDNLSKSEQLSCCACIVNLTRVIKLYSIL